MLLAAVAMRIAGDRSGTDELTHNSPEYRACFDDISADWARNAFPHKPMHLGLRRLSGLP